MTTDRIAELEAALKEAVYVARACKGFADEQADSYFRGERANWKRAAIAVIDEIDGKPDEWAALIGVASEAIDPTEQVPA